MRLLAAMAVLAWASIACAGSAMTTPPTPPAPPTPTTTPTTVVATWTAEDGSVVVLNVVVPVGTRPDELPRLARDLRDNHPGSRVIVNVFAARAGPERFVIGHVPSGDEPRLPEDRPPTLLATYDYPRRADR